MPISPDLGQGLWLSQNPGRAKSQLRPKFWPGLAWLLAQAGVSKSLTSPPPHHTTHAHPQCEWPQQTCVKDTMGRAERAVTRRAITRVGMAAMATLIFIFYSNYPFPLHFQPFQCDEGSSHHVVDEKKVSPGFHQNWRSSGYSSCSLGV